MRSVPGAHDLIRRRQTDLARMEDGRKDTACHLCIIHLRRTPKATCSGLDFDEFNLAFAQGSRIALSGINETLWVSFGSKLDARNKRDRQYATPRPIRDGCSLYGSLTVNEVERITTRNLSSVSTALLRYHQRQRLFLRVTGISRR